MNIGLRKDMGGERSSEDSQPQSPIDLAVRRLQAFVSHNSDQAVVTIANMLRNAPQLIEKFEPLLNDCLFGYLDAFDLYRYKRVVKHFFTPVLPATPSKSLLTIIELRKELLFFKFTNIREKEICENQRII